MGGELVESANRRYYLHNKFKIDYDVDRYRKLSLEARGSGDLADIQAAVQVYEGHFLVGFDSEWVESLRRSLQAEHLSLLQTGAERARDEGALDVAVRLYQKMTEHEPYSETAWAGLADVWEDRGESSRAAEVRDRFERLMEDG